jgi:hypothetical protein
MSQPIGRMKLQTVSGLDCKTAGDQRLPGFAGTGSAGGAPPRARRFDDLFGEQLLFL